MIIINHADRPSIRAGISPKNDPTFTVKSIVPLLNANIANQLVAKAVATTENAAMYPLYFDGAIKMVTNANSVTSHDKFKTRSNPTISKIPKSRCFQPQGRKNIKKVSQKIEFIQT